MSFHRTKRPLLLDLFSGAGGCAVGYHRAGFDVIGVDLKAQPNYPFAFQRGDALEALRSWMRGDLWQGPGGTPIAAIHASPPCQAHSTIGKQIRGRFDHIEHADLVEPTRELLIESGLPYIMENVPGAPLKNAIQLCGSSFGLDVRRHRLFESNVPIMALPCAHYWQTPRFVSLNKRRGNKSVVPVHGSSQLASVVGVHGHINYAGEQELRKKAMDIDWMTPYELTQAIPPAYTEYLGGYLMAELELEEAA